MDLHASSLQATHAIGQQQSILALGSVNSCSGKILIVDDARVTRTLLSDLLTLNGFETRLAADGHEAIEIALRERIDLMLLDIVMPGLDGFQVLNHLRNVHTEMELPVVMVTANGESEKVVRALESGANDYVTKPFDPEVALARIKIHLKLTQAQTALRESEERYSLAAQGTKDGIWDWNVVSGDVYYAPRWKAMLGLEDANVGHSIEYWLDRIHEEDLSRVQSELDLHLCGETEHFETEFRMMHNDGRYRWMLCRGLAVRDKSGQPQRMAGSLTDITEGKVADALTGLPNRLMFLDRVQGCIDQSRRDADRQFAVLYVDIDNFKLINDSMGHEIGDQFLISIGQRLETCVRSQDSVVARLGGDEFTILLDNIQGVHDAQSIAERILDKFAVPFSLKGREVFSNASIGIALSSSRCETAEALVREADTAMYHAKTNGRAKHTLFAPAMSEQIAARLQLESDLRRAIERSEFVLHYQPIVTLNSSEIMGFEALVRWEHPTLGLVPPIEFISIAEETGLIVPIGRWVLHEACRQTSVWKSQFTGCEHLFVSVNVSSRQLSDPDVIQDMLQAIDQTSMAANEVTLEITESTVMRKVGAELLQSLREGGVRIGIDDFGTGYSSLAYLHRLPLDLLKVDRSFVKGMNESEENAAIVRTIAALADNLSLDTIAEGVETEEQLRQLLDVGCKYGQGYFFSPPLAAEQVAELLQQAAVAH